MSKTPVVTSADVNVSVASHLSNLPAMATEAFTLNPIELLVLSNSKTGTPCALLSVGTKKDARTHMTAILIVAECACFVPHCQFNFWKQIVVGRISVASLFREKEAHRMRSGYEWSVTSYSSA